jgi:hypothetical protein
LEVAGPVKHDGTVHTIDPKGKTGLFIFKTYAEEHVGEMMYFKVYNGVVKAGMDLVNNQGNTTRFAALFLSEGNKRVEVPELHAGDIGAAVKLKDAGVNDTFHEKGYDLNIAPIAFRMLPVEFTLSELQQVYELLLGRRLHKASFRRALQGAYLVEPTDSWRSEGRGRPAQLFRYAPRKRRGVRRSVRFELLG